MVEGQDPVEVFMRLERWPLSPLEVEAEEEENNSQSSGEMYMVGFVIANVVGLQYYSGRISGREIVGLQREPLNQYDPNAIKVLNTRSVQVGHIERSAARVLSPLLDAHVITIDGIVPKVARPGNRYKLPCQVHIFARLEAFGIVKSAITNGGLYLIGESDPSFTLSEAEVVKEKRSTPEGRDIDEIFKLLDEKISKKEELKALEPPKNIIKSELLLHQKEGLQWLVQRENSEELPPFWEEKEGSYVNVLTNYSTDKRPEPIRGGIFADDMGLGKTLTLLSLIALDKRGGFISSSTKSGHQNAERDDGLDEEEDKNTASISKRNKRGRVSRKTDNSRKKQKTERVNTLQVKEKSACSPDRRSGNSSSGTTLVVCPPAVLSAWISQIEEHTKPGSLKSYIYYGERTGDANELAKYDIVLTTYSILASEDTWIDSPIKKIEWWRVILDEAHVIKNVNAQQSRAVNNLKAKRKWVVTGTPIQNNSFDLYSLMAFLRFEPLSIKAYWNSLIQRPLAQGDEKGVSRLQVLMSTMSLRRTKEKALIGLPSKSIETFFVELSGEEREIYDQMESEAKRIVKQYISSDSSMKNYWTVLSVIVRLRQICIDLALCPSDLRSLLPSNKIGDVHSNPQLLDKMLSALQDDEGIDCPICIFPPTDSVITCCGHIFCKSCILKTIKRAKPCCPLCRHPLSESDLFFCPPEASNAANSGSSSTASSKVKALLKLLCASRDESSNRKSIVFSQFRKMLLLLEEPLKAAGFKILRLDGSMNAKKRGQVIKEFEIPAPEGPTILLASLKASGAGINLTAASRVYLLEPWWNPAVEEQAMDRVHRIGQKEDVKIVRMIARSTIEERILELQEKKKLLARKAFGKKGSKDQRDISLDDLRTLMHL
ncbi:putative SWI/SNF-related matrix-associated actin-dependent regulator of chromatin subfamily A member 3-like 1 [Nicotiana tabacum]|uniref:SWI/SNF-related matrix-associated actin-dependent regulator of chromatin subfamily A member 3-like 1 n=3 Tax=Nicotiana TaxID=4085 RepID=A0A1S3ZJD9_TOBAC|nr:PREDICTED: putative SWI/SNF-related matrix-associated actin-dependent regulator of chromatin subfamily A member 3-like 1 [Nicotiana sylvestris]XP_016464605.1 PREDICTED: putative SWI/SNF-related matrix-associated actin-dependent regulator of chromatin subfamily A member 3-like 1 [Nicotiana tabacum]